ncbi:alanine--tRNA ligase-related protein [Actinomadura sp. K4S16]|uniref:alanine--tRNA ligase-related protein n=1 Tax=Actinomadura sp. K4S16 TaxID=1316147 RepID=UPI0011ECFFDA|nr:alanine--tRNA ligase-related protein [Actinomadura sp. K4S16]
MPTRLLYLDDSQLTEADATILKVHHDEGGTTVVLNETIFYPQGGGQPTDRGRLTTDQGVLDIRRVSFADGEVLHTGAAEGVLAESAVARLEVDAALRHQHALLHTGGHLVMTAVDRLVGYRPTKGYHFPNGPYVEFDRALPVEERESFAAKVQETMDAMVSEDTEVTSYFCEPEELRANGVYVPTEIPAGKPTRVVVTAGYRSPCGGTHVRRLGELFGLRVRGVKVKSGRTRVSYLVG